jgi:CBS domain containing-hemolysin-like protein
MNAAAFEISVILLLLVANGVFAMAEIAVVSARKPRLRRLAEQGNEKARLALDLAESPNRFLSTVQIGITLVGIFAGAFGARPWLPSSPSPSRRSRSLLRMPTRSRSGSLWRPSPTSRSSWVNSCPSGSG